MSTFNMKTNTISKIKDVSLALVFISAVVGTSVSANAAPATTIEDAVSEFVVAQGQNMVVELNIQLQQSIDKEISTFSSNFSLNNATSWLNAEQQVKKTTLSMNQAVGKLDNQTNTSTNTNKNQTK